LKWTIPHFDTVLMMSTSPHDEHQSSSTRPVIF